MAETEDPQAATTHAVSAERAAGAGQRPTRLAPQLRSPGQAGFLSGWLMAQLYGPVIDRGGGTGGS